MTDVWIPKKTKIDINLASSQKVNKIETDTSAFIHFIISMHNMFMVFSMHSVCICSFAIHNVCIC